MNIWKSSQIVNCKMMIEESVLIETFTDLGLTF